MTAELQVGVLTALINSVGPLKAAPQGLKNHKRKALKF